MVRTLSVEPAPVRVNAIHPRPIEDSPFWQDRAGLAGTLDKFQAETLTGELGGMADIVDACRFLLKNRQANGIAPPRRWRTSMRPDTARRRNSSGLGQPGVLHRSTPRNIGGAACCAIVIPAVNA
ncbi:hypothetical protein ACJWDR_44275 [Streptomyces tauricus]|uniref:hypothetical protein n=1 Tax=Streptomyces tauricus TaxID=68274 RepID=UPI00387F2B2D